MPDPSLPFIAEHNQPAATIWNAGGADYDHVSFLIGDALAHAAQRLAAKRGESVLDVATGTGWSARNVARTGAHVTAIDIAPELLEAARRLSRHLVPPIDFQVADAENLPFPDGRFDRVISTFGVMFAGDPGRAAAELGRVCRSGGRLCLATWAPDGAIARFFGIISAYRKAPPPASSPLLWGNPTWVQRLLGRDFVLRFEPGVSHAYHEGVEEIWDAYVRGFGPLRTVYESLEEPERSAFHKDVDDYHRHYADTSGRLHIQREYLLIVGERR